MNSIPQQITGNAPAAQYNKQREVSEKEKTEIWFVDPLKRMKDDEAFVFLIICFPLLESIIRHELEVPDDQKVVFAESSPALKWFAEFMTIPEADARSVWDAFRNGLLHRVIVKDNFSYQLTGKLAGRPATISGGMIVLHVWDLRDKLVGKLERHHKKLWNKDGHSLPKIYVND
jgi:hypothetical protein